MSVWRYSPYHLKKVPIANLHYILHLIRRTDKESYMPLFLWRLTFNKMPQCIPEVLSYHHVQLRCFIYNILNKNSYRVKLSSLPPCSFHPLLGYHLAPPLPLQGYFSCLAPRHPSMTAKSYHYGIQVSFRH